MIKRCAAVIAALLCVFSAQVGRAQDITLSSPDGAVRLHGTLLGFDGEFYRILTTFGELTVDGSGVLCEGPACPNLDNFVPSVTFSGSSTIGDVLLPALVEGFALSNGFRSVRDVEDSSRFVYVLTDPVANREVARFRFHISNTDEGFADLLADEADLVMALRQVRPVERVRARDAGLGDLTQLYRSRVIALDALVPVVSPEIPLRQISLSDLAQVFSGGIQNWSDVGGPDAPISIHLPGSGSGHTQAAQDLLLQPANLTFSDQIQYHRTSRDAVAAVLSDPFGISLASYAEVGAAQTLTLAGACEFRLDATRHTIKTEDYPLTAPMFLYIPARRLPKLAREFLAYAHSAAAQLVVRRAGFVDLTAEEIPLAAQGDRLVNAISSAGPEVSLNALQAMMQTMEGAQRLTLSFRFEAGSSKLDTQSRSNVLQLARMLESGQFDGRQIGFYGFSDGVGPADANRTIAMDRAEAVRTAVTTAAETVAQDKLSITVEAFGEAMPMACDDTAWGRQVNRRVEVWVR